MFHSRWSRKVMLPNGEQWGNGAGSVAQCLNWNYNGNQPKPVPIYEAPLTIKDVGTTPPGGIYARKHSRITAPKRKPVKPSFRRPQSCTQSNSGTQTNVNPFAVKPDFVRSTSSQLAWPENGRDTLRIELIAPPISDYPSHVNQRRLEVKPPAFRPGGGAHFSRWRPQSAPKTVNECKELIRREQRPYSAIPSRSEPKCCRSVAALPGSATSYRRSLANPPATLIRPYSREHHSSDNVYLSMKCPKDYMVKINFVPNK